MPLDGVAWSKWGNRLEAFLVTDTPALLVRVTPTGASVPFTHQMRDQKPRITEAGFVRTEVLGVSTQVQLNVGEVFSYDGDTWTVTEIAHDKTGEDNDWPFVSLLEMHAR